MDNITSNNKRIAKNTFILYLRTILVLGISLYTSRVVLNILGVENYGIYNIVGGFVALFSIVSATMVASTQRYLTYELGKKEDSQLQKVFGVSMTIHIILGGVLLILFETVGLWFLNEKLNISPDRMIAANWLYQCSILTFLLNILSAPYNAMIIAQERMKAFAYINVLEVSLKLLIVYMLLVFSVDRLIMYGIFLLLIAVFIRFIYTVYCRRNFKETKYVFIKDINSYKEIVKFAGLNFFGACSAILSNQGVNILLNIFYGVTVNAARGITLQVEAAITKFVNDFTTALNPQITKSYARGDKEYMLNLAYQGSKFSYFLFLFLALPIFVQAPWILSFWLKQVPDYTVIFIRYALIISMLNTLSYPLTTCAFATGKIKILSIWLGSVRFCVLPVCYIFLKQGFPPYIVYVVILFTDFILLFIRLYIVTKIVSVQMSSFFTMVITRTALVTILSVLPVWAIDKFLSVDHIGDVLLFSGITCLITVLFIYTIGLTQNEKESIRVFLQTKLNR